MTTDQRIQKRSRPDTPQTRAALTRVTTAILKAERRGPWRDRDMPDIFAAYIEIVRGEADVLLHADKVDQKIAHASLNRACNMLMAVYTGKAKEPKSK